MLRTNSLFQIRTTSISTFIVLLEILKTMGEGVKYGRGIGYQGKLLIQPSMLWHSF